MTEPASLEDKFAQWEGMEQAFLDELDKSLNPRGSDMLYDLVAGFGLPAGAVVLDVGCGRVGPPLRF